jgi:hypothetical protein
VPPPEPVAPAPRSACRWPLHHRLRIGSAVGTPSRGGKSNSVSTIERSLAALGWNYAQRGEQKLDRKDRAIATVMAGIRNKHAAPPRQKETILPEDLIAMLETLDRSTLRGLRLTKAAGLWRLSLTGAPSDLAILPKSTPHDLPCWKQKEQAWSPAICAAKFERLPLLR